MVLAGSLSLLLTGCTRTSEESQSPAARAATGAAPASAQAGHRLALVIGNDSYQHAAVLHNARADARAVAAVLKGLDFTVTLKQDVTYEQMKEAMRAFKASVSGGDEVVFYYSGHGVQFGGSNYLIAVDLVPQSEAQVADDSVGLQRVLDDLSEQKARFALAIIDACRDDPFKGTGRAIGKRGLAMQSASGQMVMYSAGAGQEALDRLGASDHDPNGVFTRVLIKEIRRPGLSANQLLKSVSSQVIELARSVNHVQVPALYDESIGEYYFVPAGQAALAQAPASGAAAPPPTAAAAAAAIHVATADELEQEYWDRIRDSTDAADFRDYAKQFPAGPHAAEAALEVRRLSRSAAKSTPVTAAGAAATVAAAPVTRAAPLTAAAVDTGAPQPSATAVAPGSYGGYTTDSSYPGMKVLGRLMLAGSGEFEYRGETGAVLHGTLDLSRPDDVSGRAMVRLPNGSSTGVMIRGKITGGKLVARYQDGWRDSGDIVFDFSNPL
ncbi:MAG TPA: caspase family protein [Steroidobacteraceae bacterium]|nr:caspase family protein [Steroidobacteraceae bacterium]